MIVEDTKENRRNCLCPKCPTYPHDCSKELLYCSTGKSKCDINASGCICNVCPVWFQNKLTSLYFCDKEEVWENKIIIRKKKSEENPSFYSTVADIKTIASTGKSTVRSMGSLKEMPYTFSDLHFIPAQVQKIPKNLEEKVNTEVVIGPSAKKPLIIESPIMISGMSFGAVSKNVRTVISHVAKEQKIAFNSGEGGILEDELKVASKYMIGQYATGRFGVTEDRLKRVAAIEIRFGQGAYPGKGSYLPAEKMTEEIAKARGLKSGEAAYSPAHHSDMTTPKEIKEKIAWLKKITKGIPVGAKIGCGNIEKDIDLLVSADIDFIALDGFGGGTGATDYYVRENIGIPIIAALPRARRHLEKLGRKANITLIAGGGLRTSADFAKCLALGADAVYIGTAALIAINCEQYRICHTGLCPTGVTTHNPALTSQLDVEKGIKRLGSFIETSTRDIANLTRIVGKDDIKKLDIDDIVSLKKDTSELTGARWLNGEHIK